MSCRLVACNIAIAALCLLALPAAAADHYASFTELAEHETAGVDYRITAVDRQSPLLVLAIHGGYIEPGTAELALAVAGNDYSLYAFEALRSRSGKRLHVTSTHFDEPQALGLVADSQYGVSLHGVAGAGQVVYAGGRDKAFIKLLAADLRAAGFTVLQAGDPGFKPEIGGGAAGNICNRTATGAGVQLELSAGLRKALDESNRPGGRPGEGAWQQFTAAVRSACKSRSQPTALPQR